VLRYSTDARPPGSVPAFPASLGQELAPRVRSVLLSPDATAPPPAPYPLAPAEAMPARAAAVLAPIRSYPGPLQLDLDRIVLPHRVENVPAPPEFIFVPFVPSRLRAARAVVPPPTIDPRPCRVVDEREACRRIDRGWRVDVAPCVNVGAMAEASRRQSRRRSGRVTCGVPPPIEEVALAPLVLEAASA
jgi:hypothetical protein